MLGVGVGSGLYELGPSREWDELPPVIFLNAPETFHPMPFKMEQKHVQLEMGYVSETELNVLTHELLLLSCSKEMRERSLEFKSWAKIQWKPESKVWESLRESEWMRVECESSTPIPRPLFKGRMAGHRWEKPGTTASDRWKRLGPLAVGRGPADARVRPNHRWATLLIARAHCPSNGQKLLKLCCRPNFASKRCSNLFFKGFSCSEIFLDFCEK